jgi:hypothetical protein
MSAGTEIHPPRTLPQLCALAAAAVLSFAAPARAFPIVFDGPGGFGVSSSTAGSVESAGFLLIQNVPVAPAAADGLTIPAPDVLTAHIVSNPSLANPNTAQSRWSVTDGGADSLQNAWLVFFGPVTYTPTKVGIDLPGGGHWRLVEVSAGESGEDFYPAVFLGNLNPDDTATFLMNHVVGQPLTRQGQTLILPQYSVGVLTGVPLPEPGTLALLAAGVAGAALRRGRKG